MDVRNALIILTFASSVFCYSGQYVPKSYYVIDQSGQKSDVVYFRSKRDVELFPLLRMKRGGGSSASSHSSASAQSSSGSGTGGGGGGGAPLYQGGHDYNPGIIDPGFAPDFDPSTFLQFANPGGGSGGGYSHSFASSSSSSSSGTGPGFGGVGGGAHGGHNIPTLFSRFGEDTGTGVKVSGAAQGPKGAFSSSSSSIDSDGKITYSVKSGKI